MTESENTWNRYQNLIISELSRLDKSIKELDKSLDDDRENRSTRMRHLEIKVAMLEVKASFYGAIGGLAMTMAVLLLRGWK